MTRRWLDEALQQSIDRTCQFIKENPLRPYALLLVAILTSASAFGASDPFVATWIYNAQKSPKPTIKYTIKDLGGERYALTGSTGQTTEIKADGLSIKSPSGATVSFKKLDDHNWEMDRSEGETMVRTYTVSADDKTLTLHDVFTSDNGGKEESVTKYARLAPGNSIFGEWQSFSIEDKLPGEKRELFITLFGSDGLSISVPSFKHNIDLKFDGKVYFENGASDPKGHSASGKRIDDRTLEIDSQNNGELDGREELKLSDDEKTLTIVDRPAKSSAVFTSVWDRQ